jgi:ATP/maltotriose-dependent transcriptional regulator MalT
VELVERDEPLAALAGWLGEAGSGAGRMVLIAGEAGIGKTSLVHAFCDRHRDEARIWRGACDALSTPRPLGPLHDIARSARGRLVGLMSDDVSRHERFSGFLDALAGPLQPTVAVIEDVHWADEATRDLLVFLARRIGEVNALVVVTYRDDEVGASHPLRRVLGSVVTLPSVERWTVQRLSRQAVGRMAEGRGADVDDLLRVTGGNPFFLTEVLATGSGGVPATVTDAVLARVQGVSDRARAVVEAASVVPDEVEVALIEAGLEGVMDDAVDAVEECVEAGLLVQGERSLRFRHELARLAVERSMSAARRRRHHAAALAWLTRGERHDPARLAYHAAEAGDRDAVLIHAPVAAEQAARQGAHREAVAHLERVVGELTPEERSGNASLFEQLADQRMAIDREADALAAYDQALAGWRREDHPERTAVVLARRAYALWGLGRNKEARASVGEAIGMLEGRPAGLALATASTYSAHLHMLAREVQMAIGLGQRAVDIALEHGDRTLAARAMNIVGAAQWFVDPDVAERTLAKALEMGRESDDDELIGIVLRMLGSGGGEVRRYVAADHHLEEAVRWCTERDLDIHGDYCLAWLARSHFEQGRWAEATRHAEEVAARRSEHAPTRIVALSALGRVATRRGALEGDRLLREAWDLAQATGDLQRMWPAAAGLAERAWLRDEVDRLPDLLLGTFELAQRLDHAWAVGELGFWLWRAGVLDGPPEGAAVPFALQMAGDWRGAAAAWEEVGCPYEVAVALADGDDPDALRRALTILGELGAAPMADRVAARLRALGVHELPRRPSRATVGNPGGLTARQLEVLALLVEGRTNPQIAASLHISPKTAGHHVSAILTKLGVADRHAAVRVARERGVLPT